MNESAALDQVRPPSVEGLSSILERVSRLDAGLVGLTVAAPLLPPEAVFLASQSEPGVLWSSSPGLHEVGIGNLYRFRSAHAGSWPDVARLASETCGEFQGVGVGACSIEPRLFGGVSFLPAVHHAVAWEGFADHEFVLPRILYRIDSFKGQASLTLFAARSELRNASERDRLARCLDEVAKISVQQRPETAPAVVLRETQNPTVETWITTVNEALRRLRTGELEKVVLARELVLHCSAPPDLASTLRKLLGRNDGSVCFAFRSGVSTFLGSTPERLVLRRGPNILTEALAGSAAADDPAAVEALARCDKDSREHSIVVREIANRLRALHATVTVPEKPELRRFGPVVHLRTVLKATSLDAPHVLVLGSHLHPTPAVAGIPMGRAIEFIQANEPFQRGRYASPTGWFDLHGDGELVVGLRSGLVRDREIRLFAGAGLVDGSEPNAEWRETEIKLRSLLDALGVYGKRTLST